MSGNSSGEKRQARVIRPEAAAGERSEPEVAGGRTTGGLEGGVEDPEVRDRPRRRRFTAEYKLQIVQEADRCTQSGELGALLRREGLYWSALTAWRRARDRGAFDALKPKKRGPKARARDPHAKEVARLCRENERLRQKLETAELIIDVQKKVSRLLGIPLQSVDGDETNL